MLHLVLDHSALVPCGDKPEDEKEAIRILGDRLLELDTVWYVSAKYLKTLYNILRRELKYHHPLPSLQAGLNRTILHLLEVAHSKSRQCKPRAVKEDDIEIKLKLHIIGRNALAKTEPQLRNSLLNLEVDNEDREVLAIALEAIRYTKQTLFIITTDNPLLEAASNFIEKERLDIEVLSPKQLLERSLDK